MVRFEKVNRNLEMQHFRCFQKDCDKNFIVLGWCKYFLSSSTPVHHMIDTRCRDILFFTKFKIRNSNNYIIRWWSGFKCEQQCLISKL